MPKLIHSVPKYRKHRASGQAVVSIQGKDIYLGPWRSRASRAEYDRLIGEWLAAGRPLTHSSSPAGVSIAELIVQYWRFAKDYYRKNGESTGTAENLKPVLALLRKSYGSTLAADFGPLALKAIRETLTATGSSRRYVNDNIDRIKRMFRWAAAEELVPPAVPQALSMVAGLRKGRSDARESEPIQPVPEDVVQKTLPHLSEVVCDMVRFQRLTGARPGEICIIRPCDVNTSEDAWVFRPASHKTQHHGRERVIFIGPKGQAVLRSYLLRGSDSYCFSPADSEQKRLAQLHTNRATPLSCGNRPGTNRRQKPKRKAGDCYTNDSYRRAIQRACDLAFPPPADIAQKQGETLTGWNERLSDQQRAELKEWRISHRWAPNQLRHSAATEIRQKFGLEAAQVSLGHSSANITQVYAERDATLAQQVALELG